MMTGLHINSTQQNNDKRLYVLHTPSRIKYTFKGKGKFSNFCKLSVSDQKEIAMDISTLFYINILINFDQLYIITINIEKLSRNCTHTIQIGEVGRSDIEKGAYAYWYTINKSKCVSLFFCQ